MENVTLSNLTIDDKDEPPHLKCIFYAEFDSRLGPRIVYQIPDDDPENMISKEMFDSLSGFFITKPELLDKFIKVNTIKLKMMGHPVVIENKKYERNAFIFNLCFVVDNLSHLDCLYEPIVRKMAHYLINLEVESEYLSKESTKSDLKRIMRTIFHDLNFKKECAVQVNDLTRINLKLMPKVYPPTTKKNVSAHDAPMLKRRFNDLHSDVDERLDVVTSSILGQLNGFSPISQISENTQIDKQVVCRCVENLQYHGLVSVLPVFLYTNFYAVTSKVRSFYESDDKFKAKFCTNVALQLQPSSCQSPKFSDVFRLLCRIQPSLTIRDWCLRNNPRAFNVDERKLIQLAIYNGFIRKLNTYPATVNMHRLRQSVANGTMFYTDKSNADDDTATTTTLAESSSASTTALDGSKSIEELTSLWGQKPSDAYQRLENNPEIALLVK